jgi:hypothetical protein
MMWCAVFEFYLNCAKHKPIYSTSLQFMNTILFILMLVLGGNVCAQSLTLPELKNIKSVFIMDNVQLRDAQIVYPVTGLNAMKVKQEYNPMTGSTQYIEVELWLVDARGKVVYYYTTTTKGLADQLIDNDYVRYMNRQGHHMKYRR